MLQPSIVVCRIRKKWLLWLVVPSKVSEKIKPSFQVWLLFVRHDIYCDFRSNVKNVENNKKVLLWSIFMKFLGHVVLHLFIYPLSFKSTKSHIKLHNQSKFPAVSVCSSHFRVRQKLV